MNYNVTVVIPTIGEKALFQVVNSLVKNNNIIKEIIIVIPKFYYNKIELIQFDNIVKIIKTDFKSQVKQRILGFRSAKYEFVLQLDSDILLEKNCMSLMCDYLTSKGKNSAISFRPIIKNTNNFLKIIKNFLEN